ncbi:MAG: ABC transporter ATP-binding protein [Erysipelotrichaceae bacterium]|nr:ABC transporter ATP-binding protein [Erysipelotrichaceae bacterium]
MIRLNGVTKIYHSGDQILKALDNVSLSVPSGSFLAVLGPSGCGKSTLLNILAGYEEPDEGEYLFAGQRAQEVQSDLRRQTAMIFQEHQLLEYLNVRDNLLLPSLYSHERISREMLDGVCRQLGIEQLVSRYPNQLSGGEKQRCGIARAVLYDKRLILADEPTGSLDRENADVIMDIFERLHGQGRTIIMVTHDQRIARRCERIISMEDGHVVS